MLGDSLSLHHTASKLDINIIFVHYFWSFHDQQLRLIISNGTIFVLFTSNDIYNLSMQHFVIMVYE